MSRVYTLIIFHIIRWIVRVMSEMGISPFIKRSNCIRTDTCTLYIRIWIKVIEFYVLVHGARRQYSHIYPLMDRFYCQRGKFSCADSKLFHFYVFSIHRIGIKCQRIVDDRYRDLEFIQWKIKALPMICAVMCHISLVLLAKWERPGMHVELDSEWN